MENNWRKNMLGISIKYARANDRSKTKISREKKLKMNEEKNKKEKETKRVLMLLFDRPTRFSFFLIYHLIGTL
jgi:hypothetical protein